MTNTAEMSDFVSFLWIAVGVILSILVPWAVKALKEAMPKEDRVEGWSRQAWKFLKPYLWVALASLVVGFVTLAGIRQTGGSFKNWWEPMLAGYLYDATLQKIKEGLSG